MSKFRTSGFDDLARQLGQLADSVESASGKREVPISELLTDGFFRAHTSFKSINDFATEAGYSVDSLDKLITANDPKIDALIARTTDFKSLDELRSTAVAEYYQRLLGI